MNEIRDRLQEGPRQIRLLCRHRHFMADAWLEVPAGEDDIAMTLHSPDKRDSFNRLTGSYGFAMSLAQRRAPLYPAPDVSGILRCPHRGCRYTGKFRYGPLAVELAVAALAGQREWVAP